MIPRAYITAWRSIAPWKLDSQVEQDLILCRSLLELFSNANVSQKLAFRGGTALHKLHLTPPTRYSEDIDLVQIKSEPIGNIIDTIRKILDSLLGRPLIRQKRDTQIMIYRMSSEIPPIIPLRLKIEINSREHFTVFGFKKENFKVKSRWFSGSCEITTYDINELLGTKLRALYQRRKGRDLYDLWLSINNGRANPVKIVRAFHRYINASGLKVSKNEFMQNLDLKMQNHDFLHDTDTLLRPEVKYDPQEAYNLIEKYIMEII